MTRHGLLRPALRGDVYAVMGNHDFIEMLPPLEAIGIRFLMNESVLLRRGDATVCLAGVDVRFCCPPEVTLHRIRRGAKD